MSTRSTIAYGEAFHLYHEMLDGSQDVHLRLDHVEFEAGPDQVTVRIPIHIWEYIRQHAGFSPSYAQMSVQELLDHVVKSVDDRIQEYASVPEHGRPLISFCGSFIYGLAGDPREQQIKQGLEVLGARRQQERDTLRLIATLAKTP